MSISSINNNVFQGMVSPRTTEASFADPRPVKAAEQAGAVPTQTEQSITQAKKTDPTRQQVEEAAKQVNDFLKPINNSLEFQLDDTTGKTIVKVIDTTTKDVIRQFPSEEMLSIAKAIDQMKGLLVHQKA
jgi:flagellar protein FlaG